tara:strand:+ start:96 stop:407 length:312 start_codon:yes stop_codon:yes gene_type:complete
MKKKNRIKYSNGSSVIKKTDLGKVGELESKYTANTNFQSVDQLYTKKFGNTKINLSRYKDSTGNRSKGRSIEQNFGDGYSVNFNYTNPKFGPSRYGLTFRKSI